MKNKGLVIIGIVLIIISLIFGAYFVPIYTQAGEFRISGIDPACTTNHFYSDFLWRSRTACKRIYLRGI
jgi:hypothetical protein